MPRNGRTFLIPFAQAAASGMLVALCGLGAVVGYGLGRKQAALGVAGDDIEGKLKGIIAEQLGVDEDKVTKSWTKFVQLSRYT